MLRPSASGGKHLPKPACHSESASGGRRVRACHYTGNEDGFFTSPEREISSYWTLSIKALGLVRNDDERRALGLVLNDRMELALAR